MPLPFTIGKQEVTRGFLKQSAETILSHDIHYNRIVRRFVIIEGFLAARNTLKK